MRGREDGSERQELLWPTRRGRREESWYAERTPRGLCVQRTDEKARREGRTAAAAQQAFPRSPLRSCVRIRRHPSPPRQSLHCLRANFSLPFPCSLSSPPFNIVDSCSPALSLLATSVQELSEVLSEMS